MRSVVYHEISAQREANSLSVALLPRLPYSAHDNPRLAVFGIALERQTGVHAIGGDRRQDFDTWPGATACTPPGLDVFSESATGGEYIVLRWTCLKEVSPVQRLQRIAPSALLRQALDLRGALLSTAPPPVLNAAVQSLATAFDSLYASTPHQPLPNLGALRALYGPLLVHIDDALGEFEASLSLAALSVALQRTPLTFLREFKQLTGLTPHAYINERRLQRARAGCEIPEQTLAEVAAAAGYASQSHMGVAFKRALQNTPGAYRRAAMNAPNSDDEVGG